MRVEILAQPALCRVGGFVCSYIHRLLLCALSQCSDIHRLLLL